MAFNSAQQDTNRKILEDLQKSKQLILDRGAGKVAPNNLPNNISHADFSSINLVSQRYNFF